MTEAHEHDYDLSKKVKIMFKGMDYFVMPRYKDHYLNHEYERFSLQILKNDLNSESLFVDIGAHYGAYSLYAAHESNSSVIAVEPVVENYTLLKQNITANKLKKVKVYDYAASDENGDAEFNIPWASDSAGFYTHPNADTIRVQKVKTRIIDDIIDGKKVAVIKIDVEGHELGVLRGLKKTLKESPEVKLIVELNPPLLENAGTNAMGLLEALRDLDKEIYMVDEDKFTMYRITDDLARWPEFINEGNYANLYCVPKRNHEYLLFVSHGSQLGGAEMAMVEQMTELKSQNIFSHVILPSKGPIEPLLVERGIGYTIVEDYSFWITQEAASLQPEMLQQRNFNNMNASVEIADIVAAIKPTAIVNNSLVNPWGYTAAQLAGVPLIWMVHEYGDLDHNLPLAHGIQTTKDFVLTASDLVVCCSDAVRTRLVGEKNPNVPVQTIYNLLREEVVAKSAEESIKIPFVGNKKVKLCVVGSLTDGKGQIDVLNAVSMLKLAGVASEVLFIGTGTKQYENFLKAQSKKLAINDSVKFLGFVGNPYPYMKASDIIVVASRNEAFGRVTAEAMMLGVPVIAANTGGSLEMIEDTKTGFLYVANDVRHLVSIIQTVTKMSPKSIEAVTNMAHTKIRALLDTDKNIANLAKLIRGLSVPENVAATKRAINYEWADALRVYKRKLAQAHAEKELALQQAKGQENINLELLGTLEELRNSKGFRVATKLSKIKQVLKPGGPKRRAEKK